MDFHEFVEKMIALLQERMGEEYEIKETSVVKNNGIQLTGVIMMRKEDTVSPTIYLEELYRDYRAGNDMQEIADKTAGLYEAQLRDIKLDMNFFSDFQYVKDRIFHKVIHYEKNRKLLEDVPHFIWCDLAVVFYYAMEEESLGKASVLIHNNHLDMWGQPAGALYQTAQRNMKRSMPELLVPMWELIDSITGRRTRRTGRVRLYVLTNRDKFYGASAMLYSVKIRELADRWKSDLLILPSSVHEVLLLPDDKGREYGFYRQMVEEVNTTQVEPEEILSYSLYRYSREKAEIEEINV